MIGKEVVFVVDYKVPASGREYGTVYLGKDIETGENISEDIVREGLASVRKEGKTDVARLVELEEKAKSEGKGRWAPDAEVLSIIFTLLVNARTDYYINLSLIFCLSRNAYVTLSGK